MALADRQTIELKRRNSYSDFLTSFEQNPVTGNLAMALDEEAIKQSMINLILTGTGERFYYADKGSRVPHSLFEPNSPETIELIALLVKEVLEQYEPRVIIHDVRVGGELDGNEYDVTIIYAIINNPNIEELSLSLKRVR